jgi:hypothetical protein
LAILFPKLLQIVAMLREGAHHKLSLRVLLRIAVDRFQGTIDNGAADTPAKTVDNPAVRLDAVSRYVMNEVECVAS